MHRYKFKTLMMVVVMLVCIMSASFGQSVSGPTYYGLRVGSGGISAGLNYGRFTVAGSTGNTYVYGTLAVRDKFTVSVAGAGNFASTLNSAGAFSVATNKFNVAATGALTLCTNKFTVDTSGNTAVAGTLGVTGAATLSSTAVGPGGGDIIYRKYARITRAALIAGGFYGNGTDAGVEILPAIAGRSYRVLNARILAYGGALARTNATGIELCSNYTPGGTAEKILFYVPYTNLAQANAAGVGVNQMIPVTTNNTMLADGGSFTTCTVNKSIILISTTAVDWTTATGVDVGIEYVVQ